MTATSLLVGLATEDAQEAGNQTLADILAKIIAAPASEAKLEAVRALLAGNLSAIAPAPTSDTVTIAINQSLSGAVQVDGKLVGIILPTGWTAAAVTFLGATTLGGTYAPIYDAGVERTIASADAVAGRMILLPLSDWLGVKFLKIRSGTAATAVAQVAQCEITILMVA
jgi:hypothetical protein